MAPIPRMFPPSILSLPRPIPRRFPRAYCHCRGQCPACTPEYAVIPEIRTSMTLSKLREIYLLCSAKYGLENTGVPAKMLARCLIYLVGLGLLLLCGIAIKRTLSEEETVLLIEEDSEFIQAIRRTLSEEETVLLIEEDSQFIQDYPPCGEVCSYDGQGNFRDHSPHYTQLTKHFNCDVIMRRMAYRNHTIQHPPPKSPPAELYDEFTQFGDMPVKQPLYKVGFHPDSKVRYKHYTKEYIADMVTQVDRGENVNTYSDDGCMIKMMQKYQRSFLNMRGVVVGSLRPWLETMLLSLGASHVTTLEYINVTMVHRQLTQYTPYAYAERFLQGDVPHFEFGASYSSVEHSGLGRYGDPINPYGDLEAMAQVWCMMAPGGIMVLGVPSAKDNEGFLRWNAHRAYGTKRLQFLTANWKLLELHWCEKDHPKHLVAVLQKPLSNK